MQKSFSVLLMCCLFGICTSGLSFCSEEKHSNSFYWTAERSTPEKTLSSAIKALSRPDYFHFYALVSNEVVSELNAESIHPNWDIWGIEVQLWDFYKSDYSQRYGNLALFDMVMAKIAEQESSWADHLRSHGQKPFTDSKKYSIKRSEHKAKIKLRVDGKECVFFLVQSEGKWYLNNVRVGSEVWRKTDEENSVSS